MSTFSDAVLALSPTSYWRFEGASPLADSGSAGITLTATGSPVRVPSLVPSESSATDNAYDFDGSTMYLAGGDNYSFTGDIDFTIALWAKVESATFGSGFQRIIAKRNTADPFAGWMLYGSGTSNLTFDIDYGATTEGVNEPAGLELDESHFVVYSWDDSAQGMSVYVDGSLLGTDNTWTSAPGMPSTTGALNIAAERNGSSKFAGVIDDVAIWSGTALSSTQIGDLWTAANSSPPVTDGPPLRLVQSNLRW